MIKTKIKKNTKKKKNTIKYYLLNFNHSAKLVKKKTYINIYIKWDFTILHKILLPLLVEHQN